MSASETQRINSSNLQQNLLQETNHAYEMASMLGRQYNALLPISILPLELFLKIIRDVISCPSFGYPSNYLRYVSQVCHHWRKAVLGAPLLWSQLIDCNNIHPKWFRVVLRRARSSPLRVTIRPLWDEMEGESKFAGPNVHLALRNLERVGGLDILCSVEEDIVRPMINHFQQPAPSLQCLTLSLSGCNDEDNDTNRDIQCLPANIFRGVTAPLRRLTLSRCLIDFKAPLYRHLTSLSISQIFRVVAPSVSDFLHLLRNMPDLTSLALTSAFSLSTITGRIEDVHLPRLSSLKISGMSAECSQFLSHLHYPALSRFELHLRGFDPGETEFASLIKHQLSTIEPFLSCTVRMLDKYFEFSTRRHGIEDETESPLLCISCSMLSSVSPTHTPRILLSLVAYIAPRACHCERLALTLDRNAGWPAETTFKCLTRTFSSVKRLDIMGTKRMQSCQPVDDFFRYISTPESEQPHDATSRDSTAPKRVLLPNLQNLYMNGHGTSGALISFLEYRRNCGLAIETIEFRKGFEDPSFIQSIKSLCISVTILGRDANAVVAPNLQQGSTAFFSYGAEEADDPELDYIAG
ncbi:hypothetical protein GALMADRAFT_212465 [Galerina marginata CBS 339.88]|uniref:Uncharacterized protein n=1 Tax=Galerina marginata (strain CBS 339.88) TaxID=685588 RepID=A0A067SRP3_GALM3|nr:hypothetical protein GALMADRAFT_212465 [Galerina marginata CBS 339.88]